MFEPKPPPFTLWVFRERDANDVLLVAELEDGQYSRPVLAPDADTVKAFFERRGWPKHMTANSRDALRYVREAEPRLFHVSADVLKPPDLVGVLLALLLLEHRDARS